MAVLNLKWQIITSLPSIHKELFFEGFKPVANLANYNCREIPNEVYLTVDNCHIKFLEHVQVKVNLNFSRRGDLYLELEAPSGTTSPLTRQRQFDNIIPIKNLTDWVITTLFNWGESPEGQWKLKIENLNARYQNTGKYF